MMSSMSPPNIEDREALQRFSSPVHRIADAFRKRAPTSTSSSIEDPSSAINFGNRIIFFGLGIFIVWATLVPLDEGIPANGVVSVETKRNVVSHYAGGNVEAVSVHENKYVKAGDVLITLDNTKTKMAYNTAIQEYIAASAKLARLKAEQIIADEIEFSDELHLYAGQMGKRDYLFAQVQLFRLRRQALKGDLKILEENLSASKSQLNGVRDQLAARLRQVALLRNEIQEIRPLVEAGYTPRNNLLAQERQLAELESVTSDLQARILKESSTGSELRLKMLQRQQEFLRDVEMQIADTEREVANLRERISDVSRDLDLTVIRAPVSGQVVELQMQTIGAAVTPGSKILEIIPEGGRLLVDVQIPTNLINRVTSGLPTQVQISTFTEAPSLVIEGLVQSVSSDQHVPASGLPYYLARIEITPKGIADLRGRKLRPGMPVTAVIKTGERSLLAYLIRPLLKRTFTALQEP